MAPRKKSKNKNGNGRNKNGNGKNKPIIPEYSEHQLRCAIEEYKTNKISIRAAAKKYCIPSTTLYCKAKGVRPIERKMGPKTILSSAVEKKIVKCLFTLADAGFPITKFFPRTEKKHVQVDVHNR